MTTALAVLLGLGAGLAVAALVAVRVRRAATPVLDEAPGRLDDRLRRLGTELAWLRSLGECAATRLAPGSTRQFVQAVVRGSLPGASVLLVASPEQVARGLDPAWGPEPGAGQRAEADFVAARAAAEPVVLDDDGGAEEATGRPRRARRQHRAVFPLRHGGEVLGVLSVRYPAYVPFPDDLKHTLAVAAALVAAGLTAARGRGQAARDEAVVEEIASVTTAIGASLALTDMPLNAPSHDATVGLVAEVAGVVPAAEQGEAVWRRVVEAAQAVSRADGAALILVDEASEPRWLVGTGWQPEKELRLHLAVVRGRMQRGDGTAPLAVADTRAGTGLDAYLARAGLRALAAVPIRVQGQWVGSLYVCFRRPRELSSLEQALLVVLGSLAALSVHADRLLVGQRTLVNQTLEVLGRVLEACDPVLAQQGEQVADLAARIGGELGLGLRDRTLLWLAGRYRDLGHVAVRSRGATEAEHAVASAEILAPFGLLRDGLPAVLHHHERFDGAGAPHGLRGLAVPLTARVLSAAAVVAAALAEGGAPRDRLWRAGRALQTATEDGMLDPHVAAAARRALRRLAWPPPGVDRAGPPRGRAQQATSDQRGSEDP